MGGRDPVAILWEASIDATLCEGAGENGQPGWQTLGLVSHEGELHPPRWTGDWEELRPRVVAWVVWQVGWRQTVEAREIQ